VKFTAKETMMEDYTLILPNIEGGLIVPVEFSEGDTIYIHAMK
jgi:hypothetical protein